MAIATKICGACGDDEFNEAADKTMEPLASGLPMASEEFQQHFAIYQRGLFDMARDSFATLGLPKSEVAEKEAVQRFHWYAAFGGFVKFIEAGRTPKFSVVARRAMHHICKAMQNGHFCDPRFD